MKKKTMLQKLGLLGLVSFLSYSAAVVFAPLAYPDYNWMAQAVSDLSAADAPSLALWNRLSALYSACEVVCVTAVCLGMQGRKSGLLRTGITLFAAMEWVSAVGLPDVPAVHRRLCGRISGRHAHGRHGRRGAAVDRLADPRPACGRPAQRLPVLRHLRGDRACMMLVGALGMKLVPAAYFGIVERFSVFAATGFNAALGLHLFFA